MGEALNLLQTFLNLYLGAIRSIDRPMRMGVCFAVGNMHARRRDVSEIRTKYTSCLVDRGFTQFLRTMRMKFMSEVSLLTTKYLSNDKEQWINCMC